MKTLSRTFLIAAVFAAVHSCVGIAKADLINLTDASFEAAFTGDATPESGWTTFGSSQPAVDVSGGFWGDMANRDGTNAAYAFQNSATDGGSIYQAVQLDAGVTYTFTAGVGTSTSVSKNDGKFALVFFNSNFSTLLAETTGIVANQTGGFADHSVSFTPTTTGNYRVGVRNRGYVVGTGANNNESTIFFDNARLTAVPEPSSAALLGVATGLGLLVRRRR